jgi:hypothetical protein
MHTTESFRRVGTPIISSDDDASVGVLFATGDGFIPMRLRSPSQAAGRKAASTRTRRWARTVPCDLRVAIEWAVPHDDSSSTSLQGLTLSFFFFFIFNF